MKRGERGCFHGVERGRDENRILKMFPEHFQLTILSSLGVGGRSEWRYGTLLLGFLTLELGLHATQGLSGLPGGPNGKGVHGSERKSVAMS